ncbi:large ribosomal subunit protein bL19c-like [Humulus lupulus]|uniref:large ribosomal subunit protein bL19c-like n=1 Tax=Humulus lupulus TaxID=3486 RepID=UPI002B406B2B|nr:large ribosomal subunit protein bL19c-like [Humulus lupulus]
MSQSMARILKPQELVYLNRPTKELLYRRLNSSAANGSAAVKFVGNSDGSSKSSFLGCLSKFNQSPAVFTKIGFKTETLTSNGSSSVPLVFRCPQRRLFQSAEVLPPFSARSISTMGNSVDSPSVNLSASVSDVPPRIKFKRLDKTARNIMQILDREAVQDVRTQREIPEIKPGYIVQLKVEVPENKRRVSILKGIVIARRNAGLNTTFRIRRLVAGVGVESLFPLYSPNIKEIKVLEKKKVRRAKLYYLRDKMNALKKQ